MNVARLRSPVYALCLSILAVAAACGTADPPPTKTSSQPGTGGSAGSTGTGGGSATTGSAGASATGTGGAGGGGTGGSTGTAGMAAGTGGDATGGAGGAGGTPAPLDPASPLPLIVDSIYAPSGFMGDGATPGAIVLANGATDCPTRAPGNIGKCSKFTYTPIAPVDPTAVPWGGVYWQSPTNNWGTLPGKHIAAGATKVTFYAAGAKGGEVVTFLVGGITGAAYQDPPKTETIQTLTTTMTQYSIDLTGYTYVSVIGGFGWTIEATPVGDAGAFNPAPVTFYVDAIEWVQ